MPSNDTENIYATQYGGEGEPIPATKISYDNTDSGLTADDVQEAIDEVVEKINDGYILIDKNMTVEVTGDGTKTCSDLFTELTTAINSTLSSLENDEIIFIKGVNIEGLVSLTQISNSSGYTNTDTNVNPLCIRMDITNSALVVFSLKFGGGTKYFKSCSIDATPTVTITDRMSDVPTSGAKVTAIFHKYKKV